MKADTEKLDNKDLCDLLVKLHEAFTPASLPVTNIKCAISADMGRQNLILMIGETLLDAYHYPTKSDIYKMIM